MTTTFQVAMLISIVCWIVLSTIGIVALVRYYKNKNNKKEKKSNEPKDVDYFEILLKDDDIYVRVNNLIDSFITEASRIYLTLKAYTPEDYFNQEYVNEYEKYLRASVKKNMSEPVRAIIGFCYNINSEEDLDNVLNLRIKLFLIDIVSKNNVPIDG